MARIVQCPHCQAVLKLYRDGEDLCAEIKEAPRVPTPEEKEDNWIDELFEENDDTEETEDDSSQEDGTKETDSGRKKD